MGPSRHCSRCRPILLVHPNIFFTALRPVCFALAADLNIEVSVAAAVCKSFTVAVPLPQAPLPPVQLSPRVQATCAPAASASAPPIVPPEGLMDVSLMHDVPSVAVPGAANAASATTGALPESAPLVPSQVERQKLLLQQQQHLEAEGAAGSSLLTLRLLLCCLTGSHAW